MEITIEELLNKEPVVLGKNNPFLDKDFRFLEKDEKLIFCNFNHLSEEEDDDFIDLDGSYPTHCWLFVIFERNNKLYVEKYYEYKDDFDLWYEDNKKKLYEDRNKAKEITIEQITNYLLYSCIDSDILYFYKNLVNLFIPNREIKNHTVCFIIKNMAEKRIQKIENCELSHPEMVEWLDDLYDLLGKDIQEFFTVTNVKWLPQNINRYTNQIEPTLKLTTTYSFENITLLESLKEKRNHYISNNVLSITVDYNNSEVTKQLKYLADLYLKQPFTWILDCSEIYIKALLCLNIHHRDKLLK